MNIAIATKVKIKIAFMFLVFKVQKLLTSNPNKFRTLSQNMALNYALQK